MKKILLYIFLFIFCLPSIVFADGGMIPYYSADNKDIYEPSQTALIVYNEGMEDLYIKAGYEGETNKFVWIVPTPSYPEAELAPYDIFDELSIYTRNERSDHKVEDVDAIAGNFEQEETNVVVHSQEQVGIYEVTVLSATGVDGIYTWLEENNYPVKEDIKDVLDWYIQKEWYFTAMRIDPSGILDQIISDFDKEVDTKITKDNLAEELANYCLVGLFLSKDFIKFQKSIDYLLKLAPKDYEDYDDFNDMKTWSEEKFQEEIVLDPDFFEEDVLEQIDEVTTDIQNWIYRLDYENNPENIDKYSDYIEPIKISFRTNSLVYPLKISQISTLVPEDSEESLKTNEVLLYVLSETQVKAPEFNLEFNKEVNKESLENFEYDYDLVYSDNDLESFKSIVGDKDYYLTKMRRNFAKVEMDEDLYLIEGEIENDEKINDYTTKPLTESYQGNDLYIESKNKIKGSALSDRLKGKIIIKVEDDGKAYYINPINKYSYYLGRPDDAFQIMREQGIGITNKDLYKIQIGVVEGSGLDNDGDGLSDYLEATIGLDASKKDTDGDGYEDGAELLNGNNPWGEGKQGIDNNFSDKQKGKILLQVENKGEAWYVNPEDGKRYFLGRPIDAFGVMRNLGLGISNNDFDSL